MGRKVKTPAFTVSFPVVFEPRAFDGGDPKYSVTAIFKKADEALLAPLKEIAREAAVEKFGAKLPSGMRSPFRDGSEKEALEGFGPDTIFVNFTSKQQPGLVDHNVQRIVAREEFYAGCRAMATVTAYAYDQKGNKGVAFGLHNLQKLGDGTRIDGRAAAESDFTPTDVVGDPPPAQAAAAAGGDADFLR